MLLYRIGLISTGYWVEEKGKFASIVVGDDDYAVRIFTDNAAKIAPQKEYYNLVKILFEKKRIE